MLASYGAGVGLASGNLDWSISCLPTWSGNPGRQRAATICVGRSEIAHVWLSNDTGQVAAWGFKVDLPRGFPIPDPLRFEVTEDEELERGAFLLGTGYQDFLDITADSGIRVAARAAAERSRERSYTRQSNWHNSRLAVFLELEHLNETTSPKTWDVPVEYVMNMVKSRRHQAAFRRQLWRSTDPAVCAVCGIAVEEILEAAHIIPDADGGPSTFENGLLLCANHHLAMDRKLFAWDGAGPVWADELGVKAKLGTLEGRFIQAPEEA